ncbi:unnamed protein product [Prorocentrum cordatum]|uniref:Uncharacterized protein n=1 Tax=Prorocentrum cordatum TaxID=2364126 RepID=A0ABN9XNP7_9DINO|nr:unnamed protein product [Polarella glacialis]
MCMFVQYGEQGWWHKSSRTAKDLPTIPMPTTSPDPHSKRQKALAASKAKRKQHLEQHLHQEFDLISQELHWEETASPPAEFHIGEEAQRSAAPRQYEGRGNRHPHLLLDRDETLRDTAADAHGIRAHSVERATRATQRTYCGAESTWGPGPTIRDRLGSDKVLPDQPHRRDPEPGWWSILTSMLSKLQILRRGICMSEVNTMYGKLEELQQVGLAAECFKLIDKEV